MGRLSNKSGFTLAEILVSVGIFVIFLPFAANMLTNSRLLGSFSKHKIQAAYAAQQIIETQRQNPVSTFAPMLAVINPVNPPIVGQVVLDTKGNYANVNCATNPNLFCGTATITITPTVYTNSGGLQTKYTATYQLAVGAAYSYYSTAHMAVKISWNEQVVGLKAPMNEYYAADIIISDTMLN